MTLALALQEDGRKFIHIASSIVPLAYWLLGREIAIPLLAAVTLVMFFFEYLRIRTVGFRKLYDRFLGDMTRPGEAVRITGATYVFVGMLVASFYDEPIAITAMLFLSFGDSAAAIIGIRYGKTMIGPKSLEGSLACFGTCMIVGWFMNLSIFVVISGAITATIAELISMKFFNDNIAIPLFSGGIMTLTVILAL